LTANSENTSVIHSVTVYNSRLRVINAFNANVKNSFANNVLSGLLTVPKFLSPKYFYDVIGSDLFEKICTTPEYYVTRTETSILQKCSNDIARINSDKKVMVELGSGSSIKTKYLLKSFLDIKHQFEYVPIDVSEIMISGSIVLLDEFEGLKVSGILSEYEAGLDAAGTFINDPKIIVFLGSSIGNFNMHDAEAFIKHIACIMHENDSLLIGFDLVKDMDVLNAAYNDKQGYTAAFNLNQLTRINSELGGEFDIKKFDHKAFFNSAESRIEMHLESLVEQDVCIHGLEKSVHFRKGETIHTENSYKFTDEMINSLAAHAGLNVSDIWKDDSNYFALCLMKKGESS